MKCHDVADVGGMEILPLDFWVPYKPESDALKSWVRLSSAPLSHSAILAVLQPAARRPKPGSQFFKTGLVSASWPFV